MELNPAMTDSQVDTECVTKLNWNNMCDHKKQRVKDAMAFLGII